jgi:ribonucleoside-diphosphate reductase alpha chain
MQKFVDQTISANTSYDPSKFESGKVPMKVLLRDLLTTYKLGIKTLYYHNTRDGANGSEDSASNITENDKEIRDVVIETEDESCGGACKYNP